MSAAVLGWDVGGAHLKRARIDASGRIETVDIVPCPLWRGLDELDTALAALGGAPADAISAVTMTGELVDLFPDRASGVAALARRMAERLAGPVMFYAGEAGFVAPEDAAYEWARIASANWRATAEALAMEGGAGLLIDIGSTTADIIPFGGGRSRARGTSDFDRMAARELVYLGAVRTPVMAIATEVPVAGALVAPMAEHFATSADVFRLTGDLPEGADLHPAADGGAKTEEASARRLLRMVGLDLTPETERQARALAAWLAEEIVRRLAEAAAAVLAGSGCEARIVHGAGVGRFLAARVARRLGLLYRDVWSDDPAIAPAAADCAPAVAVARLYAAKTRASAPRRLSKLRSDQAVSSTMSDRIFIRGIQVHAYHGVFEEENRLGQKFTFDVDYWVDAKSYVMSDEAHRAVSYADVHDVVIEVAKGPTIKLIETLAERIAQSLLETFASIEQVRVVVHKPGAPITGVFSDVGVEITRRRGGASAS